MSFSFVSFNLFAFETYPYKAAEKESLGTILYSIGAKRLWGNSGSVKKHLKINQIASNHEFLHDEVLRIHKEDIRFKCNVELRGDIIIIKRALFSKKDRLKLLRENPNCLNDKISQIQRPRPKIYNTQQVSKIINKRVQKIKEDHIKSVAAPKKANVITRSFAPKTKKINYRENQRISYLNSRSAIRFKNEDNQIIQTVNNSSMGFSYEHLLSAKDKGLMANFRLSAMAIDSDPNFSYNPQGSISYELGYKFNEALMLSSSFNAQSLQYISENNNQRQLNDLTLLEGYLNVHYLTSFFKKQNKITVFMGASQSSEELKGASSGIRSEILIEKLSFGVYYHYRSLFDESSELTQNKFGLTLGTLF